MDQKHNRNAKQWAWLEMQSINQDLDHEAASGNGNAILQVKTKASTITKSLNWGRSNLINHPGFSETLPVIALKIWSPKKPFNCRETTMACHQILPSPMKEGWKKNCSWYTTWGYIFMGSWRPRRTKGQKKKTSPQQLNWDTAGPSTGLAAFLI